jgi:hypothetical protein
MGGAARSKALAKFARKSEGKKDDGDNIKREGRERERFPVYQAQITKTPQEKEDLENKKYYEEQEKKREDTNKTLRMQLLELELERQERVARERLLNQERGRGFER